MIFSGLPARIALLAFVPVLGLAALASAWLGYERYQAGVQEINTRGTTLVRQAALALEGDPVLERERLRRYALGLLALDDVLTVSIDGLDGQTLVREQRSSSQRLNGNAGEQPEASLGFEAPVRGALAASLTPDISPGPGYLPGPARVHIELSRAPLFALRSSVLIDTLGLLGLGALFGLLAASLGSIAILTPFERVQRLLNRLRNGQFEPPLRRGDDGGPLDALEEGISAIARLLREQRQTLMSRDEQTMAELHETLEELEIKNAELDIARKKALAASQVKSEFLANMSHEIRTPMNGVLGFVELLAKTELSRTQQGHLQTIRASARHLMTILNDILDFSKIEAGKFELAQQPFDLRELLENAVLLFAPNAHAKNLSLVLDVAPELPSGLIGDGPRIAQIVTNLVSNAVKFTDRGQVEVCVRLCSETAKTVTFGIAVLDTGIGFAPQDRARLFSAFDQIDTSPTRRHGGTGLGLAICRRLVQMMGGDIHAESVPGEGACFEATLRLDRLLATEAGEGAEAVPPPVSMPALLAMRDETLARALTHILALRGVAACLCRDVNELEAALSQPPAPGPLLIAIDLRTLPGARQALPELLRAREQPVEGGLLLIGGAEAAMPGNGGFAYGRLQAWQIARPPVSREVLPVLDALLARHAGTPLPDQASTTVPAAHSTPGTQGLHVLLADDNLINRQLARLFLQQLGAQVDEAANGLEAVQRCAGHDYDVVLMDIQMPELDGLSATRRIRAAGPNRDTPIVALTAEILPSDAGRYRAAGIDDQVIKPVTEEALVATLLKWGNRCHLPDPQVQA